MPEQPELALARSREEIVVARVLSEAGFPSQATSRLYYAAFYAAEAALAAVGEARSKHSAVIAAFGRLVIKDGGLDPAMGRILRDLFDDRNDVDCEMSEAAADEVEEGIRDAERFVAAVEAWVSSRG